MRKKRSGFRMTANKRQQVWETRMKKYLPYAVLKVQKITTFTKDNKDTKEIENQLVMTAGSLSV